MAETTDEINPIQKLMEGFCSPRKVSMPIPYDDTDEGHEEMDNDRFAPDLTPQKPKTEDIPTEPIKTPEPKTEEPEEKTEEPEEKSSSEESEIHSLESSKRLIANRTKRGVENFIMACIFLLTTLLTLKKLGFNTSDFDLTVAREAASNGSLSWIHVFDKSSVEDETPPEPMVVVVEGEEMVTEEMATEETPTVEETSSEDATGEL